MLFYLVLEGVIRRVEVDVNAELSYKSKQLVRYADNIVCLARSPMGLREIFKDLEKEAKEVGL